MGLHSSRGVGTAQVQPAWGTCRGSIQLWEKEVPAFVAACRDLEDFLLSEISQTKTNARGLTHLGICTSHTHRGGRGWPPGLGRKVGANKGAPETSGATGDSQTVPPCVPEEWGRAGLHCRDLPPGGDGRTGHLICTHQTPALCAPKLYAMFM